MTYKTHISVGLLFSSIVYLLIFNIKLTPVLALILIFSTIIGATAPDLDTPTGKIWHKIPAGGLLGRIVHPVFIGGHRHLSHSILGLGIFTFLFYLLIHFLFKYFSFMPIASNYVLITFFLGYLSHIFADMFTESGVPLLFPLKYHLGIPPSPFEKIRIKTGRWFENLIIYPGVNILLISIIYNWTKCN